MCGFPNFQQISQIPRDLGLYFKWTCPDKGANAIIVENVIEYKPYSFKLLDKRTNTRYTTDTKKHFIKLCEELAKEKGNI